ncbi:MAG: hypothetical protein QM710_11650 [Flavobacterium sp.]
METGNYKSKAFIYDTSKGFARLIKRNFSDLYDINVCYKERNFDKFHLYDYNVAFVAINSYEELAELMKVKEKIKKVFVITGDRGIQNEVSDFEGILLIDIDSSRKEAMRQIGSFLNFLDNHALST